MAIKLLDTKQSGNKFIGLVYADAKTDVPASDVLNSLTASLKDLPGELTYPTYVTTALGELGVVKSDGTIEWGE